MRTRNPNQTTKKKRFGAIIVVSILVIAAVFAISRLPITSWLKPIAVFSQMLGGGNLNESEGWTNVLLLGVDRRKDAPSGTLTDTIMIASINPKEKKVILLSLPRDLWIKIDKNYYAKINAAYHYGGIEATQRAVEGALAIPIHYYALVDFDGFKNLVDILGGIEVDVERAFDDYLYPISGKENDLCGMSEPDFENISDLGEKERQQYQYWCRYEHLHFDAGKQLMDGETALKYARSRHASGAEGTDFSRAKHQQNVILAAKEKILSLATLTNINKVTDLWQAGRASVETDLGITELEQLYEIYQRSGEDWEVKAVVIDGSDSAAGFAYAPKDRTPYGGQYVLVPKAGDYSEIQTYVQKMMFGE